METTDWENVVTVRPFAVDDEDEFASWLQVSRDAVRDLPYAMCWTHQDFAAMFATPDDSFDICGYTCRDDGGQVVGFALVELPLRDNTASASVVLGVAVAERGRGYGTAIADQLRAELRSRGRTRVNARPGWAADRDSSPARRFAEHYGLTLRNLTVHQVLPLPADRSRLRALQAEAAAHHRADSLVT